MYDSLRSRVLLVVGTAVFMTAISIFFLAQREMAMAVTGAEEQHARDLLETVLLNVETEYESLLFHRAATLDRRKKELKNIVALAITHIEDKHQKYRAGLLSAEEAQQQAMQAVSRLRYDDGVGYIWINDLGQPIPRMIMHPTLPELDGKVLDDPTFDTALSIGKNLFAAAVELCLKDGEGFVDYLWPKPTRQGLTKEQPKISYVRLFNEWGWVLGTGVYIDDIEAETQRRLAAIIDELGKIFVKVRVAETGYMFIFNGKMEMLIHPNIVGTEFATLKNPATGTLLFDDLVATSKTPDRSMDYIWDKPGFEGQYIFPKRAFINYFKPLDWYIGSSIYTDELAQAGENLRNRIVYLVLLALTAAFLIAMALSRGITKPLWKLTQSAMEIEQKGLAAARIPVSGTTETRELGSVLGQMVDSLRKVEEELKRTNRELEAFVCTVSHDLRTPLTPIIGYAQYLQDQYKDLLDEHALDCLVEIESQAGKMLYHMEDLLTLAKVGYLERPDQPVAVDEVVEAVVRDLNEKINESGVEVKLHPLPKVLIPQVLLSQVFANLIGNSIHYAGRQGGPIEVGGDRKDGRVRLFVLDHGPGIPEQEREGVFNLFYRGSTSKKVQGTGIGLAIVQKVAQTYGGRAWVEETPRGGCTFWVDIEDVGPGNH